jgi:hypothetical protein
MRGLIILPDIRLELDDPSFPSPGLVLPDEARPEQRASSLEGRVRQVRPIEEGQLCIG